MKLENKNNKILDDLNTRNENWEKLDGIPEKVTDLEENLDVLNTTKVDKVVGKGLSTNDYTDEEKLDVAKVKSLESQVEILENASMKKYGVRRVLGATTAELERLGDAVGLVGRADNDLSTYSAVQNDFDKIYPWSHIRNCIILPDGRVIYEEEAGYKGAEGDWMVEVPPFYLKHTNDGTNLEYWVSAYAAPGYEKVDGFYIGRFKTSEVNGVHVSRPYEHPRVTMNRGQFRTKAREKGQGWQLEDLKANYIVNVLFKVEFAHLNSRLILGNGVTSVRYTEDDLVQLSETNTNRVVLLSASANHYNVGETISVGTGRGNFAGTQAKRITEINDLGDGTKELVFGGLPINVLDTHKVYQAGQISGDTLELIATSGTAIGANSRKSVSYRGMEDLFGNVWEWIDGSLINDHQGYVCLEPNNYGDSINEHFIPLSYTNSIDNGYAGEMGYDSNYKFAEFPTDVSGGSTTKYCDYYYQNTGLRAPLVGGIFHTGASAGLRFWALSNSPATSYFTFGARLLKPLV